MASAIRRRKTAWYETAKGKGALNEKISNKSRGLRSKDTRDSSHVWIKRARKEVVINQKADGSNIKIRKAEREAKVWWNAEKGNV